MSFYDDSGFDFSALAMAARCKKIAKKAGALDWYDETPSKYGFPASTDLGGYTLIYVTKGGEVVCGDCMNDPTNADNNFGSDSTDRVVAVDTYDEGPSVFCVECNKEIESSYGDPDEPDDEPGQNQG